MLQQICYFFQISALIFWINDFSTKPLLSKTHTWIFSPFSRFPLFHLCVLGTHYFRRISSLYLLTPPTNFSNLKFRLIQFFIFLKIEWRGGGG